MRFTSGGISGEDGRCRDFIKLPSFLSLSVNAAPLQCADEAAGGVDLVAVHHVAVVQLGGFTVFSAVKLLGNGIDNENLLIFGLESELKLGHTGEEGDAGEADVSGDCALTVLEDAHRRASLECTDQLAGVALTAHGDGEALGLGGGEDGAVGQINVGEGDPLPTADRIQLFEKLTAFDEGTDGTVDDGNEDHAGDHESREGI